MTTTDDFEARVQRIRKHRAKAGSTIYVGMDESYVMPRRERKRVSRSREIGNNLRHVLSFPMSFLLGMLAIGLARYVRFHMTAGATQASGPADILAVFGMMVAARIVFSQLFRSSTKALALGHTAGAVTMYFAFPAIVSLAPDVFTALFSEDWVAQMLALAAAS